MASQRVQPSLVRRARPAEIPLSYAQRGLWFLNRLEGPRPNYNEPLALRFRSQFSQTALVKALDDVLECHETLRTVVIERDGTPAQRIIDARAVRPRLATHHLLDEQLANAMMAALHEPFDLASEIPVRVHVFLQRPDEHVVLLVLHHIAMDGWSIQRVLTRDVITAYEARLADRVPHLRPLSVQYADYVLWQRERLGSEEDPDSLISRQLEFWTRTLNGLPEQLPLPTDRPRPAVASFRGGVVPIPIAGKRHADVLELARRCRASVFMLMHAAVAVLLTRHGAGTDIAIGSPTSGRTTVAVRDIVGFLANTIVIRTDTSGNPTFAELLMRVRRAVLAACAHEDLPFERLVEALRPQRSLSRNPLFQVMLGFQTFSPELTAGSQAGSIDRVRLRRGGWSRFDLSFDFFELRAPGAPPQGIHGTLHYASDLFDQETAERIVTRLLRLVDAVVADPHQPIERIDLLEPADRPPVPSRQPERGRAPASTLAAGRFEARVEQNRDAFALVCEGQQVTYEELNVQANRVAHYLLEQGIGPGVLVAVALPRVHTLVVSLLGILKVGAAFLALEPDDPTEDLALTLASTRPSVVLTTGQTTRSVPATVTPMLLDSPDVVAAIAGQRSSNPTDHDRPCPLLPAHLACVIYPRGARHSAEAVAVSHQSVGDTVLAVNDALGIGWSDRCLAVTTVASDMAIIEIVGPLLAGATLVFASADDLLYPRELTGLVERLGITIVQAMPSVVRTIVEHASAPLTSLRCHIGRDTSLPSNLSNTLRDSVKGIVRLHGTAETSTWSAWTRVDRESDECVIGTALSNSRLYVLDRYLQPAPRGVPGDFYIGGTGVAQGYAGCAAATATRFVPDPFGEPGTRMFATGDRARWATDCRLVLLERREDRVTLGGLERDLGTVQLAVIASEGVREAVTACYHDTDGMEYVACHVAAVPGHRLDVDLLRERLERQVPKTLLPRVIVPLRELPRTPDGRVNREALPWPVVPSPDDDADETETCHVLRLLFAEVLGVADVLRHDNFFELGGTSLLVMQLINRVRSHLGIEIDIRMVFDAPTVAALGRQLDEIDAGEEVVDH